MVTSRKRKLEHDENDESDMDCVKITNSIVQPPFNPANSDEKRSWQGFCEIENDPAFFNVMLKDFGVKGVKVREVFGLDDELIAMLPKPVYGLIFLYRYRAPNENKQESICPDHVWFANQTHDHACATVALLNIVNNIPDIELGENLKHFKEFTKDFPPALRGDQIGNFEFVKQIHNSFARKMDMLNIDLSLQNQYDDRKSKARNSKNAQDEDDESGFHFIAFVPIDGEVWKLDGLDRQPQKLGGHPSGMWLDVAAPSVAAQMEQYQDGQIEFGLLSLVKDPLLRAREQFIENRISLEVVEARLEGLANDWRMASEQLPNDIADLEVIFPDLDFSDIESQAPKSLDSMIENMDSEKLLKLREQYLDSEKAIVRVALDEKGNNEEDQRKADGRRHDYGPLVYSWLKMLAGKDEIVKGLVEDLRQ